MSLSAQDTLPHAPPPGVFSAPDFGRIFKSEGDNHFGIFGADTPKSIFALKLTGIRVTARSNVFMVQGRNWHMDETTQFKGEMQVITTGPASFSSLLDTVFAGYRSLALKDSLMISGWEAHTAHGQFLFFEDSSQTFSGVFKGIFSVQFLYHPEKNRVAPMPDELLLKAPARVYSGTWNPYKNPKAWAPFCFSELPPLESPESGIVLPDLRMDERSEIHPDRIVILPADVKIPGPEWWKPTASVKPDTR